MTTARSVLRTAGAYARTFATGAAVLSLVLALATVRDRSAPASSTGAATSLAKGGAVQPSTGGNAAATDVAGVQVAAPSAGAQRPSASARGPKGGSGSPKAGTIIPGKGLVPPGVTDTEIYVLYYWKGDRTMTSPYLHGSGQEGNVDEGEAFRALIDYTNKYANGGAKIFGFPFNLHGRKLRSEVLEAGTADFQWGQAAATIKTKGPFAAISSHGSLSAYICPELAKARIVNVSTYDLGGNLIPDTNGYCMPGGMSWERQVDFTVSYLAKHAKTMYDGEGLPKPRVYGFLYAEYPPLVKSAPVVVEKLRKAGVPIGAVRTVAPDLGTAQQQVPGVIAAFRLAGVNTIIMPDAGAPLNFTHGSQASGYNPDYYIWPCSGQDTSGMVRLFNPGQWERASGLTCYDQEFNPDLTNDDKARRTEWWRQYQEMRGNVEPPAPTPIVYQSLFQLLAGLTNAGRVLTVETFRAGLDAYQPYRYDSIKGREDDPANMLIAINAPDRSPSGDVAKLEWSNTARTSGNAAQGAYVYPEKHRYASAGSF